MSGLNTDIQLTTDQQSVLDAIQGWFVDESAPQVLRLFGAAGTGKTTLVSRVPTALGLKMGTTALAGAFSGKAAHVLRSKGFEGAATLHSLCQVRMPNPAKIERDGLLRELENDRLARQAIDRRDWPDAPEGMLTIDGLARIQARIRELERPARQLTFGRGEDSVITEADLLICDEVSMVGKRLAEDVLSYGTKVLVVGDPAQLPPIEGGGYFTDPAARFETVHLREVLRQALESPITRHATWVREVTRQEVEQAAWRLGSAPAASLDQLIEADRVLVAFNDTRWGVIRTLRAAMGRPDGEPVPGDEVICLQNNRDLGVFNGQTWTVEDATYNRLHHTWDLVLVDELGETWEVAAFSEGFSQQGEKDLKQRNTGWRDEIALLTFAQAMTVHKAQGSEYPHVVIIAEPARQLRIGGNWNIQPWLYTAITRGRETATTYPRAEGARR